MHPSSCSDTPFSLSSLLLALTPPLICIWQLSNALAIAIEMRASRSLYLPPCRSVSLSPLHIPCAPFMDWLHALLPPAPHSSVRECVLPIMSANSAEPCEHTRSVVVAVAVAAAVTAAVFWHSGVACGRCGCAAPLLLLHLLLLLLPDFVPVVKQSRRVF